MKILTAAVASSFSMHEKAFFKMLMVFGCLDNGWFLVFFFFYPYQYIQIFLKGIYDFCNMSYKICSIAQWCPSLCSPWTIGCQAPMFSEFSRQVYWSGLPFPTPGDLPDSRIKPTSLVSPAPWRILNHCTTWEVLIRF